MYDNDDTMYDDYLLVSGELVESAFKLIADGLVLLLLLDQVR